MRRDKQFGLVLSDREREAARRLAAREGISVAAVLRRAIRREAQQVGVWPGAATCA